MKLKKLYQEPIASTLLVIRGNARMFDYHNFLLFLFDKEWLTWQLTLSYGLEVGLSLHKNYHRMFKFIVCNLYHVSLNFFCLSYFLVNYFLNLFFLSCSELELEFLNLRDINLISSQKLYLHVVYWLRG